MMKNELVSAYRESEKQISSISRESDEFKEKKEKEIQDVKEVYGPKIRALEGKQHEKITDIHVEILSKKLESKEKINELYKNIEKVERILSFLKPTHRTAEWVDFDEDKVKAYRDCHIEKIGTFYRDECIKIVAYISENGKPKNKYTLAIVGRIGFRHEEIEGWKSCGVHIHTDGFFDVEISITDRSTIEEIKAYYEKNKEKILKPQLEQYQEIKKEYLDVLKTYKIDDFKELIAYRCSKCGYFYTEREAGRISRIEDSDCPICEGKIEMVKLEEKGAER